MAEVERSENLDVKSLDAARVKILAERALERRRPQIDQMIRCLVDAAKPSALSCMRDERDRAQMLSVSTAGLGNKPEVFFDGRAGTVIVRLPFCVDGDQVPRGADFNAGIRRVLAEQINKNGVPAYMESGGISVICIDGRTLLELTGGIDGLDDAGAPHDVPSIVVEIGEALVGIPLGHVDPLLIDALVRKSGSAAAATLTAGAGAGVGGAKWASAVCQMADGETGASGDAE